jgi:hypothetical protein
MIEAKTEHFLRGRGQVCSRLHTGMVFLVPLWPVFREGGNIII